MQEKQNRPGTSRGVIRTTGSDERASPLETAETNCGGKITDSHHHVYDSRYPIDPAAQLRPADATAADYRALRRRPGIGRHVVVQPSTYGTDNRCLLDALSQFRADARGIAAAADTVTDSELRNLHDAGVRGGEVQKWQFLRYTDEPNRPACNGKSG